MGTYEDLKAAIADVIYQNGNNEITGLLLQQTLLSIVNNLGEYATFAGIATPNTNPGTADQNVYYLATEAGTYVNFNNIEIAEGEAVILSNKTGNWVKNTSGFSTQEQFNKLEEKVLVSDNDFINSLIRELNIDFGESGYTLADVGKIYYYHAYTDAIGLGLYTAGYVRIWGGGAFHYDKGDILDVTQNGIRVRAVFDLDDKEITTGTQYINVKLNPICGVIETMPILFNATAIQENATAIQENATAIQENATAIQENATAIQENINKTGFVSKTSRIMQGLTAIFDDSLSTEASGSQLYAFRVNAGDEVKLRHRIWLNAEKRSYSWAITGADTWGYNANTIIERGELYEGSGVWIVDENIKIPNGGKWVIFPNRYDYTPTIEVRRTITDLITDTAREISNKPASKTIIYVGRLKSRVGGYETIQEAINDIDDASINNQYELRLCSDEIYTDMAQLWLESDPTQHSTTNPSQASAAIVTKDYIHISGYNRRRKVAVYAPDTTVNNSLQFIQALYMRGNVHIDNVDFEVRNGRYAIHQESGGDKTKLDYNAVTILSNSDVKHLGNYEGATWTSIYAQANGANSGLRVEYHNVKWSPAFYMHQNANFDLRNEYLFDCCKILKPIGGMAQGVQLYSYIGANGSCQNSNIKLIGCDMPDFYFSIGMMQGNTLEDSARDIRTMLPNWNGFGNLPMIMQVIDFTGYCLAFQVEEVGDNIIEVLTSGAKSLIYGDDLYKYQGSVNAKGICIGTEFIGSRGNDYAYTFAHRLGNCENNVKTLVLSLNGVTKTLYFDKNFVTSDGAAYTINTPPAWSDSQIRQYIVEQLQGSGIQLAYYSGERVGFPLDDTAEYGLNYNNYTLMPGALLKRDLTHIQGWKYCPQGEIPEAVAVTRINPNEGGQVAICSKNYFRWLRGLSFTINYEPGTMLKATSNGEVDFTNTIDDACFVCIDNNVWKSL